MRRFAASLMALLLAGCGDEALVSLLDPRYRVELLGSADGFTAPDGLAWREGALWLADEGGSAVRVWRPGRPVETVADRGAGFRSPEDIAFDDAGNVYVSDDDAGGLVRIGRDGGAVRLAAGVASTEGLAVAPDGRVLIGDARGRRILAMDAGGAVSVLVGPEAGIAKPESMAFDGRGNLYVADNEANVLWLRTPDGRLHRPLGRGGDLSPESIAFANGALFVTDSRSGTLYRYAPEDGLRAIAVFSGDFANVQGIAADPSGNLYVSVQADLKSKRGYVLRLAPR